MDVSQATAAQGQRPHRMTRGDPISKAESAIDDAVQSGTLTGDRAAEIKKELGDLAKLLSHNSHKQDGSNNQIGSSTPLSADDRQKIRSDLQGLGRQVFAVLHPQGAAGATAARGPHGEDLFKAMDTNFDGKLGGEQLKKELDDITKLLKQNGSSNQTGSSTRLSADDRQKIRSDLQDLGTHLFTSLNPRGTAGAPAAAARGAQAEDLFKAMDSNFDGHIAKDELTSYINNTAGTGQSRNGPFNTYGRLGSMTTSVSIALTQFSVTA